MSKTVNNYHFHFHNPTKLLEKIMSTIEQVNEQIVNVANTLDKVLAEVTTKSMELQAIIADLQAQLAAAGEVPAIVQANLDALVAKASELDALNPDAVASTPIEEGVAVN